MKLVEEGRGRRENSVPVPGGKKSRITSIKPIRKKNVCQRFEPMTIQVACDSYCFLSPHPNL